MEKVANYITSVKAVMVAMFLIIVALVFDSHTLFIRTLPSDMDNWAKQVTSWLMAIGFEFTVLLTTANANYVNKRVNVLLAICTFLMTLFFFDVFTQVEIMVICRIVFVSALVAYINYIYAELFVKKWIEYKLSITKLSDIELENIDLRDSKVMLKSLLDVEQNNVEILSTKISELENDINLRDFKLQQADSNILFLNGNITELQSEIEQLKNKLSRKKVEKNGE